MPGTRSAIRRSTPALLVLRRQPRLDGSHTATRRRWNTNSTTACSVWVVVGRGTPTGTLRKAWLDWTHALRGATNATSSRLLSSTTTCCQCTSRRRGGRSRCRPGSRRTTTAAAALSLLLLSLLRRRPWGDHAGLHHHPTWRWHTVLRRHLPVHGMMGPGVDGHPARSHGHGRSAWTAVHDGLPARSVHGPSRRRHARRRRLEGALLPPVPAATAAAAASSAAAAGVAAGASPASASAVVATAAAAVVSSRATSAAVAVAVGTTPSWAARSSPSPTVVTAVPAAAAARSGGSLEG
mmetsp:Transcript_35917/g.78009  ORF Transcript_35917/g.78009 Transcript_35917/m.78009 type:complete len:295 (-) Transcript_35917:197-1081(-)